MVRSLTVPRPTTFWCQKWDSVGLSCGKKTSTDRPEVSVLKVYYCLGLDVNPKTVKEYAGSNHGNSGSVKHKNERAKRRHKQKNGRA